MTEPTIVVVVPWYGTDIPGGAEAYARRLSEELVRAGQRLEVWTTCVRDFRSDWNHDFHKPGTTTENSVTVRRFPVRKRNTSAFDAVNAKLMRNIEISPAEEQTFLEENIRSDALCDAISNAHAEEVFLFLPYMFGTTYWGMKARPRLSILQPCLHDESYAYLSTFKQMYRNAAMILCNSIEERDLLRSIVGEEVAARAIVTGIGVDQPTTKASPGIEAILDSANPYILYAGRKEPGKGTPDLVAMFASYKRLSPGPLGLVLAGPGEVALPPDAETLGIRDVGYLSKPDLHTAMANAVALCQPSRNESFSIVMMESWLSGRPVLVDGRCEVTRRHCERSNGGLWYTTQTEFNEVIRYLTTNDTEASRMGTNGASYAAINYSWSTITHNIVRLLSSSFSRTSNYSSHPDTPVSSIRDINRLVQIGSNVYTLFSDDSYLSSMSDIFEPTYCSLMYSLLQSHFTILDIGANIGCTALLFGQSGASVLAFEPSRKTFHYLEQNVHNSGLKNIQLLNIALGSRELDTVVLSYATSNRSGGFISSHIDAGEGHSQEVVSLKRGDSLLDHTVFHFIKIDVEGHELEVLEGLQVSIRRNKPIVFLEMNHFCLNVFSKITLPTFLSALRSIFPIVYGIDGYNLLDVSIPSNEYTIMYEHINHGRWNNLVCAFDLTQLTPLFNFIHNSTVLS